MADITPAILFACIGALLALFAAHALMAAYVQPQADDYCTNFRIARDGFWSLQASRRNDITGLYAGMAQQGIVGVLSVGAGERFMVPFQVASVLYLLAIPAAAFALLRTWLSDAPRAPLLLAALAFFALVAQRVPTPQELFFWISATTLHLSGLIVLALYAAAIIRLHRTGGAGWLGVAAVLQVVLGGSGWVASLTGLGLPLLVLLATAAGWLPRSCGWRGAFALLFALAVASTAFAITAPGNSARIGFEAAAGQFGWSLRSASENLGRFVGGWLGDPRVWLLTAMGAALTVLSDQKRAVPPVGLLAAAAAGLGGVALTVMFLSFYGVGELVGRTIGGIEFLWALGMVPVLALGVLHVGEARRVLTIHGHTVLALCALAFVLLVAANERTERIVKELAGPAPAFAAESMARYRLIAEAAGGVAELPALPSRPSYLYITDLMDDPKHWINQCAARHFHVSQLCLTGRCQKP
ncbi:DUF6056 family protein [Azospirillum sp. sgz301742]